MCLSELSCDLFCLFRIVNLFVNNEVHTGRIPRNFVVYFYDVLQLQDKICQHHAAEQHVYNSGVGPIRV